jgi:inner membrane protein YidH
MRPGSVPGSLHLPLAWAPAPALLAGILPDWFGVLTGSGLIPFSTFCFVAAVWREVSSGVPPLAADIRRLPIALTLTINGFLVLISLAAPVGVWLMKAGPAVGGAARWPTLG